MNMEIEKILTYPVKALCAVELDAVQVSKHGFPHDRRFMLLQVTKNQDGSSKYENIHVGHQPESILFHPSLDLANDLVTVTFKPPKGHQGKETSIDFPLHPSTNGLEPINIEMHKSPTQAFQMPTQYNAWFSDCYGFPTILAYLGPNNYRPVLMSSQHGQPAPPPVIQPKETNATWLSSITKSAASFLTAAPQYSQVTFADCAPYLIASSRSIDDLNTRLPDGETMDILKFRPNIIVSGAEEPWDEDFWGEITISPSSRSAGESESAESTTIECIHNCARCKSINIDYETGKPGQGPAGQMLKKMQRDRRVDPGMKYSPVFGRYSFLHANSEGHTIRVGDKVVVSQTLTERTIFNWSGLHTLGQ